MKIIPLLVLCSASFVLGDEALQLPRDLDSPKQFKEFMQRASQSIEPGKGEEVLEIIDGLENDQRRRLAFKGIVDELIEHDTDSLITWAHVNPQKAASSLKNSALTALARHDPRAMLKFVDLHCPLAIEDPDGFPNSSETRCQVEHCIVPVAFQALAKANLEHALQNVEIWRAREPFFYHIALRQVANVWAEREPNKVFDYLSKNIPEKPSILLECLGIKKFRQFSGQHTFALNVHDPSFSHALADALFLEDGPEETVRWWNDQEDSRLKLPIGQKILDLWLEKNVRAAADWVKSEKAGPDRDEMINSVISYAATNIDEMKNDISTVLNLASDAEDADRLQIHLFTFFQAWYLSDPKLASAELDDCKFVTREWKQRLGSMFGRIDKAKKNDNRQ